MGWNHQLAFFHPPQRFQWFFRETHGVDFVWVDFLKIWLCCSSVGGLVCVLLLTSLYVFLLICFLVYFFLIQLYTVTMFAGFIYFLCFTVSLPDYLCHCHRSIRSQFVVFFGLVPCASHIMYLLQKRKPGCPKWSSFGQAKLHIGILLFQEILPRLIGNLSLFTKVSYIPGGWPWDFFHLQ